jgi:hypothetical protein
MSVNSRVKIKKNKPRAPETAEDYLDHGVTEEDHGDRWLGSGDMPKALRFYQRANKLYRQAVQLDNGSSWISHDAVYNIARMKFVIYVKVVKTGLIDHIRSQIEQEDPDRTIIANTIDDVIHIYQEGLTRISSNGEPPTDMLYNYAQVLSEAGEDKDDAQLLLEAAKTFEQVLAKQLTHLDERGQQNHQIEDDDDDGSLNDDKKSTPDGILDTIVSFIHCMISLFELRQPFAGYEEARSKGDELCNQARDVVSQFVNEIPGDSIAEAAISMAQYATVFAKNLDEVTVIWSGDLPNTAQRYLAQADAYIDLQEVTTSEDVLWTAYSLAAKTLSSVQDNSPTIKRKILVARGDIDWLRSQLTAAAAVKNKDVLVQNARVFYQNAINVVALAQDAESDLLVREATVKKMVLDGSSDEDIVNMVAVAENVLQQIEQQGLRRVRPI